MIVKKAPWIDELRRELFAPIAFPTPPAATDPPIAAVIGELARRADVERMARARGCSPREALHLLLDAALGTDEKPATTTALPVEKEKP